MDRETYLADVERRLHHLFSSSKDGYQLPDADRHRLEGFMQAGVFLGLCTNDQLRDLMEAVHRSVFGKSISQREREKHFHWQEESQDYSQFESPAYRRNQPKIR